MSSEGDKKNGSNEIIDAKSLLQDNATIIAGILISIIGTLANTQPPREETYLFTWNYTVSSDSNNIPSKLEQYLIDKFSIT